MNPAMTGPLREKRAYLGLGARLVMDRAGRHPHSGIDRESPMAGLDFVHLHVHSSFSLLEGALTIARLAELAKSDNQPALALTDTDNMFGALEFSSLRVTASSPSLVVRLPWTSVTPITAPVTEMRRERSRIVLLAARSEASQPHAP